MTFLSETFIFLSFVIIILDHFTAYNAVSLEVASLNHPSYHVIMPHLMRHHKLYWWDNTAHLRIVSSHDTNSCGRIAAKLKQYLL